MQKSTFKVIKHIIFIIFTLTVTIAATAQPIKHPSLLFTPERVAVAKQRVLSDTAFTRAWDQLKQDADVQLSLNNIYGLETLAFAYTMTADSRYAKKIKSILLSTAGEKAWTDFEEFHREPSWRSELGVAHRA